MSYADDIRKCAFHDFIEPDLQVGKIIKTVRAGDVHNHHNLMLVNQYPNVCQALKSNKFKEQYKVMLLNITYGNNVTRGEGGNVFFTFWIPYCRSCKHLLRIIKDNWFCYAFNSGIGIPIDILKQNIDHKEPLPGQAGNFVFTS
jgi:hypothetical protein